MKDQKVFVDLLGLKIKSFLKKESNLKENFKNIFNQLEDVVVMKVIFCFEGSFVVGKEIKRLFLKYKMLEVKQVKL